MTVTSAWCSRRSSMVAMQAALGKTSFHSLKGLFNAESIVMRALVAESPVLRHYSAFCRRIKEWGVNEAINLSLARNRPDLRCGGVAASSTSSLMEGSARV